MKALFDADILVFRCGFAAERNQWFLTVGDGEPEQFRYKKEAEAKLDELLPGIRSRDPKDWHMWSERYLEPLENALHNVRTVVNSALARVESTEFDVTMYLSGKNNFRFDVATTKPYKGNRDKAHRPTYEKQIREYISRTWETEVSDGEEADDLLGIAQCRIGPLDSVIISLDKDLDMIPGLKYNFARDELYYIDDDVAMTHFYKQLLTGDTTDNIMGLPKVGMVTAGKVLADKTLPEQWSAVITEYLSKGPEDWKQYLLEMGQLLWIRREPYQMWEPEFVEELEWTSQDLSLL